MSSEILAFVNHCSVNFQPILHCSVPKFKLKHDIIADCVAIVIFNSHQIKRWALFRTPSRIIRDCQNVIPRFCLTLSHQKASTFPPSFQPLLCLIAVNTTIEPSIRTKLLITQIFTHFINHSD